MGKQTDTSSIGRTPDAELKLRAFLEGLEVRRIDQLLATGQVGDFKRLGEMMACRIKNMKPDGNVLNMGGGTDGMTLERGIECLERG
jgi:hypothetical protein